MDKKEIISKTIDFVKQELVNAEGGHDWWHTYRVWKMACRIAKEENASILIVNLASLLHDIADSKFYDGDEEIAPKKARAFLSEAKVDNDIIDEVILIINNMSFKNTFDNTTYQSIELDVVRDADRLDAIGAIGIARTFNFGGYKGSEIYNPDIKPKIYKNKNDYKKSNSTTINHFYEKLLNLEKLMTTNTGKKLARKRTVFMQSFLDQFYAEWDGER